MEGVSLDQLHCPTCGDRFEDFNLHSDPFEFDIIEVTTDAIIIPALWFIRCPNGHKWSIKTLTRAANKPDRVQLDRYLGYA